MVFLVTCLILLYLGVFSHFFSHSLLLIYFDFSFCSLCGGQVFLIFCLIVSFLKREKEEAGVVCERGRGRRRGREMGRALRLVGRWGRSERSWEKGKNDPNSI